MPVCGHSPAARLCVSLVSPEQRVGPRSRLGLASGGQSVLPAGSEWWAGRGTGLQAVCPRALWSLHARSDRVSRTCSHPPSTPGGVVGAGHLVGLSGADWGGDGPADRAEDCWGLPCLHTLADPGTPCGVARADCILAALRPCSLLLLQGTSRTWRPYVCEPSVMVSI